MESDALEVLFGTYRREIFLYLYSLSKNKAMAEDLLQETFLKALLSLKKEHKNVRAWLYLVARNLFLNEIKKKDNRTELCEEEPSSPEGDPLNGILNDEKTKQLYLALGGLDFKKREVLELQYFGELPVREIAGILKISEENVRVLAYRGKKELKKRLEAMEYEF